MSAEPFLAFVACAGCGESFPVRSKNALARAKWCSDRCRKQTLYSTPCSDCGAPLNGSQGFRPGRFCVRCSGLRAGERQRIRYAPFRAEVERLWAEGATAREIATHFGWTTKQPNVRISIFRRAGYDLPYRRTPEQIARMTDGSVKGLRRARAVYAEQRRAAA